ncbi:hypothetical protein RJ639_039728 [Escallonia herrerae]|uniref:Reverse transcriptase/retrotransposon-derived protein RNase H-like domain-containing protein n=1 Tax=Escallonia herrerae TaxID=1293975 RepID=A0AA89B7E4_9ASTE|nr:hypothetical protein RJ639_039728 [Escallonia herrerae]
MPQCDLYDETGDPGEHVYQFETNMLLLQVSDAVMCRAFPTILRKAAHAWFKSLQPRSIYSCGQLSDLFQKHFVSCRSRRKNSASLLNVVQEKNESLACFLGRFNAATLEIDNLDESMKYTAFLCGLQSTSKFAFSVNKSPPSNIKALLEKANKYIQAEEYLETNRGQQEEGKEEQKKRSQELTPQGGKPSKHSKRDERRPKDSQQTPPEVEEKEDREEHAGIINTISGGLAAGGSSGKSRKAYAREVCTTSQNPSKKQKTEPVPTISFFDEDLKDVKMPHDDPLVVTIKAGNFEVKRMLVDNGSSAEILFYDAFKKMNIPTDRLRKMDLPLYGFSNHSVAVEGIIALPVAIRTPLTQAHLMLDFVVVKAIRKTKNFAWTDGCQTSFEELKTYLSSLPLLSKPFPGKDLFMYLSVTEVAVSTVLVRNGDGVQKPIYYVSKVLQDVEIRYPKIDRIALALITSARRL